jgi:hypothetical protein
MAIFSNVNVGTAPNDGTGDSLRTSFIKVNDNFQDILSIWPNISENELFANITSTYVSTFNLVEAETLSTNVLSSNFGNIEIISSNVNISGVNLSVTGTLTTTANINAPTLNGNIFATTGTFIGDISVDTVNGNIDGDTATLSGNITGTSSNLISINHVVRSPSGNNLDTPINGTGDAYEFILNTTDSVGPTVAFTINAGTTVTATVNATIAAGLERTYMIFNPGPSLSNLVLPFLPNRSNINTDTIEISGNTTAFVIVRTVNTDIGNVFVQVANI